jgi:hypothetical protein
MKMRTELIVKGLAAVWIFSATIISISSFKEQMPGDAWRDCWDFAKLIIGPAIGAGIAFFVNDFVHKRRKRDEERTAIYAASFAIGSMLEDFMNLRVVMRHALAETEAAFASAGILDAPLGHYAKPQIATFVQKNSVDLASLHFLLHLREGQDAYRLIQHLERTHQHLITTHTLFNETLIERQTKMSAASKQDLKNKSEVQILGLKTYVAVLDFLIGIVDHIQQDERIYIDATNKLAAAADIYLNEITPLKHRGYENKRFIEENLPPLPRPIAYALKYGG